jgi:hypothetical protein
MGTSRTRTLEAEVSRQRDEIDRLRAENRALLSSILGIAGVPPLSIPQARLTVDLGAPFDAEPLSSQSHSESSTRPLADDDSTFRPPPPANHAGTNGLSALRQESERSDSSGAPAQIEQGTRPRDDSLHSPAASRDSSGGARRPGPPGRRMDRAPEAPARGAREIGEPGGSVVPGDDTWRDAAHSASLPGANTQTKTAGETPALQKMRPLAPPHRRRSWHQINRILEIESARSKDREA